MRLPVSRQPPPWGPWIRQVGAIFRIEVGKSFLGRRALALYLLAALPVLLPLGLVLLPFDDLRSPDPASTVETFDALYHFLLVVVYFACVWAFSGLFRADVLDRSLHFYFLAPVRRELVVAGKYLAGLAATATLFCGATAAAFASLYLPYGWSLARQHLFDGPGAAHLAAYLGITFLACLGYGSVFLIAGLLLRNPILPAAGVFLWELVLFLLPPGLKKISILHYLNALRPLPPREGPFALIAAPPPAWVSVTGLLLLTAAILAVAGWRVRKLELRYSED